MKRMFSFFKKKPHFDEMVEYYRKKDEEERKKPFHQVTGVASMEAPFHFDFEIPIPDAIEFREGERLPLQYTHGILLIQTGARPADIGCQLCGTTICRFEPFEWSETDGGHESKGPLITKVIHGGGMAGYFRLIGLPVYPYSYDGMIGSSGTDMVVPRPTLIHGSKVTIEKLIIVRRENHGGEDGGK